MGARPSKWCKVSRGKFTSLFGEYGESELEFTSQFGDSNVASTVPRVTPNEHQDHEETTGTLAVARTSEGKSTEAPETNQAESTQKSAGKRDRS